MKKQCRLYVRMYYFSYRVINEWNNVSTGCLKANSMNIKNDTYFSEAGYTSSNTRWTLNNSITPLSTFHVGYYIWMTILFNLDI